MRMVEIRQLFRVEENRLAGLIETDAGIGIAAGDTNHHGSVHDGIEGLIERSQAVIAGLTDDFVSADLAHLRLPAPLRSRFRVGGGRSILCPHSRFLSAEDFFRLYK